MARKRELVVNDLARYEKSSQRLVLEDYSSCEVPAGCGGGILRWIDPQEALPLSLRLWTAGEAEVFFDGAPVRSSRIGARPGAHVLALALRVEGGAPARLALSLRYSDETEPGSTLEPRRDRSIGRSLDVRSGAGAMIVGTSRDPGGDAWKLPGFDEGGWRALAPAGAAGEGSAGWHLQEVLKTGARVVGLPDARGGLWVRCSFDVDLGGAP
ncbi:uncharacterized protein SOCEGT47_051250 [Sorangium cellulosum]|uniref:Uncharacterized protein n=1 Tax=Sorangium cellulosum TaxID=56 RepID=A0A4P2Q653_SORCE|nr:hypothetical protein [Sorangium cellulosum]AUX24586.1 uncharacterized protein SOCEGT47_051250 [Sorangium cellulosum]